jgi:predicted metalloprotease
MGLSRKRLLLLSVTVFGFAIAGLLPCSTFAGPAAVIASANRHAVAGGASDELSDSVQSVADEVDAYWSSAFAQRGWTYSTPNLLLERGGQPLATACDEGPPVIDGFYCPYDDTVKLDLDSPDPGSFASDMARTGRDYGVVVFAVAHEWAHHAQYLRAILSGTSEEWISSNDHLAIELQADCLAGVFASAYYPGSGWESEIGDAIASVRESGWGDPNTESERDHGTPSERVAAFNLGYESGNVSACRF